MKFSCEVIRDWKTKESLQYAFIEFELPEQCEEAYFKMNDVLVDDRRIHVDFSQSVAKEKFKAAGGWKGYFCKSLQRLDYLMKISRHVLYSTKSS